MDPEQRRGIVENAKYLRNVRPIDPEEIHEYVESQPHPAVVRTVLREEAAALGLLEDPDGTFVPVPDEPADPSFAGVERFPEPYSLQLEDLLVGEYGPDWHRADSGDRLRAVIRRLKEDYYYQNPVEYDFEAALGYAIYHLPDYYAASQYVLDELGRVGLLPRTLRVLDVGAGVGGPALGLHDYLGDGVLVDYHAVEPSDAVEVLERMLGETGRNFHATIHRTTAEAFDPDGEYDLLLCANVLSELDDPEGVVRRLLPHLADDGSLVAIAPADENTSTGLREVERSLDDDLAVFSPTLRLWPGESPADHGWSFVVRPDLEVPPFQRRLDEAENVADETDHSGGDHEPGEFINVDVQYSHVIFRPDGERRLDVTGNPDRFARMADADSYVTQRVDLLGVKLSHDLAEGGGNPVFKVGDGSERESHFAVLARETALNRDLRTAEYGDLLVVESVLALWNDDEGAYNLVVDDETVVDRVQAP